jgi:hypothetical protein
VERLDQISLEITIEDVKKRLRTGDWGLVQELLGIALPLILPRAVYEISYIDERPEDAVIVDGVRFSSQVLRKNLENLGRVFPYVLTIGEGLEREAGERTDVLEKYYLDIIGNVAVSSARSSLEEHLRSRFALSALSYMSPGSLEDWPIEEQRPLFSLLSGAESAIGVELTDSFLMVPRKSVSGIYFPTEVTFHNCQLCPRPKCEGRKAPYDKNRAEEYGVMK